MLLVLCTQTIVIKRFTVGYFEKYTPAFPPLIGKRSLSKHYDVDSLTGEAKVLLASVWYLTKRLMHQEPKPEINLEIEAKLRQRVEKHNEKITQLP